MWEPVNNCTSTWSYTIQHHIQDLGAHEFQLRSYFFGKNLTFVFLPAGCWQGRSPKMFPVSGCLLTVHPVCLGLTRNIGRNPYLLFSPSNKVSSASHSKVLGWPSLLLASRQPTDWEQTNGLWSIQAQGVTGCAPLQIIITDTHNSLSSKNWLGVHVSACTSKFDLTRIFNFKY